MIAPSVLCVIPARMGSTRVPLKNIQYIDNDLTLVQQALSCCDSYTSCISTDEPSYFYDYNAYTVLRPSSLSDSSAQVSTAVQHALLDAEHHFKCTFDIVVTLMPAIASRSKFILSNMLSHFIDNSDLSSSFTAAVTHPWVWKFSSDTSVAQNSWFPYPQKNSQDLPLYLVEHASIILNRRAVVLSGSKWVFPLSIHTLPSWSVGLDIDTVDDLSQARHLYPHMRHLLDKWQGANLYITDQSTLLPDM